MENKKCIDMYCIHLSRIIKKYFKKTITQQTLILLRIIINIFIFFF